jgi:hypothetical protein
MILLNPCTTTTISKKASVQRLALGHCFVAFTRENTCLKQFWISLNYSVNLNDCSTVEKIQEYYLT